MYVFKRLGLATEYSIYREKEQQQQQHLKRFRFISNRNIFNSI